MATIRDTDLLYVQRGETPHNWTGLELKALVRATGKDGKLTVGNYLTPNGSTYDGSANLTINVDGTSGIEANKVVVRDSQGSFSGNVISANSFVGDGSQLTNAGAILSAHSGTQRLVTTTLTSGAMITAATSSDLSFTDTDATLNIGDGIKLLGTTGSATLTGSIDADSYIASDRAGDLSETFRSQKEGITKLTIYNTGRVDTKSTINIATTNSSAINIFPSESIGTASIILQNNGNASFTGSLTIGGGNIQLNSNGNASFSGTVTANLFSGLKTLTRGSYLTGGNYNGQVDQTWNVDATVSNTANKVVARDGSGNFSAGTITASLSGNASTASNADKLDGLDSTQFLRSDADDTTSGTLASSKADQAFVAQSNGTSNAWRGRILSKNSSSDRVAFLGVYADKAGVFAHNHALSGWQDLYINTIDATTGGNVRLPASTYVNGHAAVYNSGTWNINVTGSSANAGYSTNSGYASNSDKCDGLHVHGGRNSEANKIVRTDGNGYIQAGWINTVSGVTNSGIVRVYASQDDYIRYCSPNHLANSMTNVVKTTYNTSLNSDSRNSRGVTRLYRRDGDTDYSVQTYWSGSRWILYGYNGDTGHAPCQVSYADSAGSASNASSSTNSGYANSAGSATNAGYASSAGYANSAGSATNAGYANSAGSAPANGGTSSAVTINYNNNSNSTYQMLWGSGNSVYGTGGIYCNPNANYIYASLFVGGLSGNASSATNAGYANSAGSATNAGYANSAGSATNAGYANNANLLDNINSTQFLRSDAADYKTAGSLIFNDNIYCNFGTGQDVKTFCNGINYYIDLHSTGAGAMIIRQVVGSSVSDRFTFQRSSGNFDAAGNITAFVSDIRLKTDIEPITNALDKVKSLRGFTYAHNETAKELGLQCDRRWSGVSAQEIEKVLPEAVFPAPINDKYLTVQYEKIVPLLIEAIKEQQVQIEELKSKLNN